MHTTSQQTMGPVVPSETEALLAKETSRRLAAMQEESTYRLQLLHDGQPGEVIAVPAPAMQLLVHILSEMAEGNAVELTPVQEEITTQQAADILTISRQYFVQLLEEGVIPFRKVGVRRRVRLRDVIAYKRALYEKKLQTLNELTVYDQELGLQ
jgi:excisionase family DNA binding protein